MVKYVVGDSTDKLLFHTVFWVGSGFQVICAIILCFFSEDKYDYGIIPKEVKVDEEEEELDYITTGVY